MTTKRPLQKTPEQPHSVMVQGTTSDAGKSTLVAGLCRALSRRGFQVAPFKPQNMALNSAVTEDGLEIGRAQAVQAQACGISASVHMNPVLIKPHSDTGAQIIIHGKALSNMDAQRYHNYKPIAKQAVMTSFTQLTESYQAVIVEGAGSPAEINLRENDIANMGFAEEANCPVIIIADIDKGGVFAHLVGTLSLLSHSEQHRVKGFVINRFRGDLALLQSGLDWLEQHTGKPVLGVLPYLHNLHIEAEDAINNDFHKTPSSPGADHLKIVVPVLPHISNHTDFDSLRHHPQVTLTYVNIRDALPAADLIILPGSKSVRTDLGYLQEYGWDIAIKKHLRYGGKLIGICGGLQMLGTYIHDPKGIEGPPGSSPGLNLLELETELADHKQLRQVKGLVSDIFFNEAFEQEHQTAIQPKYDDKKMAVTGYEIHAGESHGVALQRPLFQLEHATEACSQTQAFCDGAISEDKQIIASYVHGLFDEDAIRTALLSWAGLNKPISYDYHALKEKHINRVADACETHLDMDAILSILSIEE